MLTVKGLSVFVERGVRITYLSILPLGVISVLKVTDSMNLNFRMHSLHIIPCLILCLTHLQ